MKALAYATWTVVLLAGATLALAHIAEWLLEVLYRVYAERR